MPIYEYICQECGERTEALQKVSDEPLRQCPSCGGSLRKLLSAPAFQFKGSGWYVTDYARKGKQGDSGSKESSDSGSSGDSKSSDAKPSEGKSSDKASGSKSSSAAS